MSRQAGKELNGVELALNAAAIRGQLKRLLTHPLFTNSKRYPVLLAYTVEQVLLGHADELKERTIGVEAFGREPSYDVNLDPVVRTTAAEVRRRLVQYYYNPDHARDLIIELPLGSYVPTFYEPAAFHGDSTPDSMAAHNSQSALRDSDEPLPDLAGTTHAQSGFRIRRQAVFAILLLFVLLVGFGLGRIKLPKRQSNMERFWAPITTTSNSVTYCLGKPVEVVDRERRAPMDVPLGNLNASDVISLARSVVPLVPQNRSFRVVSAADIGFAELREGPIVLIGAFDNPWTLRITQDLPFGLDNANDARKIIDRKSNPKRSWTFQWQVPGTKLARDYAIVARIHDNLTGQPVIVLGGILGEGTEAAGEVVSNPVYLDALLQKAPKNWDQLNLEAVIETRIVEGQPGPPTVIAVESW